MAATKAIYTYVQLVRKGRMEQGRKLPRYPSVRIDFDVFSDVVRKMRCALTGRPKDYSTHFYER